MTTYNFDEYIDRTNTTSEKHAFKKNHQIAEDVIPLWVADMDFRSPKEVCKAVEAAGTFGVFGYAAPHEDYFEAVHGWMLKRHQWDVKKEWMVRTPGVVCAIATAVRALTQKGDAVMVMMPVYRPFFNVLEANKRTVIKNRLLVGEDGRFQIDFDLMEEQMKTQQVKILILCTPHNPGGRIWSKEELERICALCLKYHVLVIADEIHHDFILPGSEFTEFAMINEEMTQNAVICTAPSKTFNIAGLGLSNIFIPNEQIRNAYVEEQDAACIEACNVVSLDACKAAYSYGEEWLDQLLPYLQGNIDLVQNFLAEHLPQIKMMRPDATYLAWLDFSGLGMDNRTLQEFLRKQAKIWVNDGTWFGDGGDCCARMNLGCPRFILQKAMEQLKSAVDEL